ncbi:MAG: DUF3857 domain-containing protein [Cyclobacteriaceae bacterium]
MTAYPKDSSAGAVILADFGRSDFDYNFDVAFYRHVRIKILNKSEFERANVKIKHFAGDRVTKLKASTYNLENGKIVESEVDKDDIFEEKVSKDVESKNFTFPNVTEGSIIEYTFEVNLGSWRRIRPWYFQHDIPVMYSEYRVELPEDFHYKKIMTGYIGLQEAQSEPRNANFGGSNIRILAQRYVARDVPAFREEPNLASPDDYISKISFELDQITIPGQMIKHYMPESYEHLSHHLATSDLFERQLNKGKIVRDEVEKIVNGIDSDEEKINAIYTWIQQNFEVDRDFVEDNYKKILEEKRGFPFDINMILLMMMQEAGFDAEPVYISTRSNGILHPYYPSQYNFNYMICLVSAGENSYLLDASDKYLPFNTIGKKCLNGKGLVISENNPRWVDLKPSIQNLEYRASTLTLEENGDLSGKMKVTRKGYDAINFRRKNKESQKEYIESFSEDMASWAINAHEISGMEANDDAIEELMDIQITGYAQSTGDAIYFNPIIHDRLEENPYKLDERQYPVDYAVPVKKMNSYTITIPQNFAVEEVPETIVFALPGNGGRFIYSISVNGNRVIVTSQLMINKTVFLQGDYPALRQFYAEIVAKQAEQIVLKKRT